MLSFKKVSALLAFVLLVVSLSSCGKKNIPLESVTTKDDSAYIEVTDMLGRKVKIESPVERVVALTAADCEIVFALESGDTVVGRGEFCDYPLEVKQLPLLQSGESTNAEQIVALNPQVVFMSDMGQSEKQILALETAGIPVVVTSAQDIADVYTAIELIGTVLDKEPAATELVSQMKQDFTAIRDKVTANQLENNTIYFEISPLEYGLWTAGTGTFMHEIAELLGLQNIFADINGWAEISQEQIIERNPGYIVTVTMYFGEGTPPVDEILSRNGWQSLAAVKNNNVFHAASDEITRPGPRLVDAAKMLYDLIYA